MQEIRPSPVNSPQVSGIDAFSKNLIINLVFNSLIFNN